MREVVEAAIGYATSPAGEGVVYARLNGALHQLLRLSFQVPQRLRAVDRAAGYAALTAVARRLIGKARRIRFAIDDRQLVDEIAGRSQVCEALVIPYVGLRCALNALSGFTVVTGATDDLTQRARAEVALNVAA